MGREGDGARRWTYGIDGMALLAVPAVMILCAVVRTPYTGGITLGCVVACCVVMAIGWERSVPELAVLLPVSVLAALAVAGRLLFAAVPNVQPVTAICVLTGCAFGRRPAFMVGAVTALVSNAFLGQGVWTPWQMYGWGLVGYVAGILFEERSIRPWGPVAYGFVGAYAYGAIMNAWSLLSFTSSVSLEAVFAVFAAGAIFDTAHAVSTALFVAVMYVPWSRRIGRLKRKFGITGSVEYLQDDNSTITQ